MGEVDFYVHLIVIIVNSIQPHISVTLLLFIFIASLFGRGEADCTKCDDGCKWKWDKTWSFEACDKKTEGCGTKNECYTVKGITKVKDEVLQPSQIPKNTDSPKSTDIPKNTDSPNTGIPTTSPTVPTPKNTDSPKSTDLLKKNGTPNTGIPAISPTVPTVVPTVTITAAAPKPHNFKREAEKVGTCKASCHETKATKGSGNLLMAQGCTILVAVFAMILSIIF